MFVRRRMLTDRGEPLLLSPDPILAAKRYMRFRATTNLPYERLSVSPLCTVPLPIYRDDVPGPRQFSEVEPSQLWHPLFWLPDFLAYPGPLEMLPDVTLNDVDDVHAVSVAVAMTLSGLYSVEHGGWLDVLSTVGVDIDTQEGLDRVAAWQEGARDEAIDSIDLSVYLRLEYDPEFFVAAAVTSLPMMRRVNWLRQSTFLAEYMRAMLGESLGDASYEDTLACLSTIASVSVVQLRHVSGCDENPESFWSRINEQATSAWTPDTAQLVRGPAAEAMAWLTDVADRFAGADLELESYGMAGSSSVAAEASADATAGLSRMPEGV